MLAIMDLRVIELWHPTTRFLDAPTPRYTLPMTRLGRPAVPFRLRDAHGQVHSLEDYAGTWLLLVLHRHLR